MKTFEVRVTFDVAVTIDETKLNEAAMAKYRDSFYPFATLEQHAEHIAQMHVRGLYDFGNPKSFVEGYGPLEDFGIRAVTTSQEEEVE